MYPKYDCDAKFFIYFSKASICLKSGNDMFCSEEDFCEELDKTGGTFLKIMLSIPELHFISTVLAKR